MNPDTYEDWYKYLNDCNPDRYVYDKGNQQYEVIYREQERFLPPKDINNILKEGGYEVEPDEYFDDKLFKIYGLCCHKCSECLIPLLSFKINPEDEFSKNEFKCINEFNQYIRNRLGSTKTKRALKPESVITYNYKMAGNEYFTYNDRIIGDIIG
jgi:hypothetical protein